MMRIIYILSIKFFVVSFINNYKHAFYFMVFKTEQIKKPHICNCEVSIDIDKIVRLIKS